ncbi:MAG: hypothetical protein KF683_12175 [Rubrivivax sp.]|nr:hypothetical protein [Rubrivivax sp.]
MASLPHTTIQPGLAVITRPRAGQRVCEDTEVVVFVSAPAERPGIAVEIVKYGFSMPDPPAAPNPLPPAMESDVLSPLALGGGIVVLGLAGAVGYRFGRQFGDEAVAPVALVGAALPRAAPTWRVRRQLELLDSDPA